MPRFDSTISIMRVPKGQPVPQPRHSQELHESQRTQSSNGSPGRKENAVPNQVKESEFEFQVPDDEFIPGVKRLAVFWGRLSHGSSKPQSRAELTRLRASFGLKKQKED